jgi:hypothetical protein
MIFLFKSIFYLENFIILLELYNNRKRKYTLNDIKSRNVIFDSKINSYNAESIIELSVNEIGNLKGHHNQIFNENLFNLKSLNY